MCAMCGALVFEDDDSTIVNETPHTRQLSQCANECQPEQQT